MVNSGKQEIIKVEATSNWKGNVITLEEIYPELCKIQQKNSYYTKKDGEVN